MSRVYTRPAASICQSFSTRAYVTRCRGWSPPAESNGTPVTVIHRRRRRRNRVVGAEIRDSPPRSRHRRWPAGERALSIERGWLAVDALDRGGRPRRRGVRRTRATRARCGRCRQPHHRGDLDGYMERMRSQVTRRLREAVEAEEEEAAEAMEAE